MTNVIRSFSCIENMFRCCFRSQLFFMKKISFIHIVLLTQTTERTVMRGSLHCDAWLFALWCVALCSPRKIQRKGWTKFYDPAIIPVLARRLSVAREIPRHLNVSVVVHKRTLPLEITVASCNALIRSCILTLNRSNYRKIYRSISGGLDHWPFIGCKETIFSHGAP